MRTLYKVVCIIALLSSFCGLMLAEVQDTKTADRKVIIVMTDGLRWQELFRGADKSLLTAENYYHGRNVAGLQDQYLGGTTEQNRAKLFPFIWNTFIPQGKMYGDLDAGSDAHVTNGFNFSYPGYSETLTGHGDPRIDSNDNKPNPNLTVLEWLNKKPRFHGKVAAFGAWEVIGGVVDQTHCGFDVNVSYAPLHVAGQGERIDLLNEWKANAPRVWEDEAFDAPVFYTALEYLKLKKPRVLFLSLGETDDWAHDGNYGEYLASAHRFDGYLSQLWTTLQSLPEYKGKTTLLLLTDHGRGDGAETWKGHGQKFPESKHIFIGLFGSGISAKGMMQNEAPVTQSQVAATAAELLGEDWVATEPKAGKPLPLN